jgi:hypothetical protein
MAFDVLLPGGSSFRVAPEATNPLRLLPVRFCTLTFTPPAPPDSEKGHSHSRVDALFDALKVELLKDAFVIVVQDPSTQTATTRPVLARTNAVGQLVSITAQQLNAPPPTSPASNVFLDPHTTYYYFWTRHSALCRKIWALIKDDPAAAISKHPFYPLRTEERGLVPDFHGLGLKDKHHPKLGLLFPSTDGAKARQTSSDLAAALPGRLIRGDRLSKFNPQGGDIELDTFYAIARPDFLVAVFLADLITALASDILVKTAEDRAVFEGVRDMVTKATDDGIVEQLEEELMRGEYNGSYFRRGEWHRAYYPYAHECAKRGVPRDLFCEAVSASYHGTEWRKAAQAILTGYYISHPDYPELQKTQDPNFWKVEVEPILKIFDFYVFGFTNVVTHPKATWNNTSATARKVADKKFYELKRMAGNLLKKSATYARFLQELDAQFPADFEQRRQIHTRFLELSVASGYRWWDEFESSFFARIKPYCDWLAGDASKIAELMTDYFGEPKAIVEFNHLLKEDVDEFERMFKKMDEFDTHFGGKKMSRKMVDGTKFDIDFANNRLKITPPGVEAEEIGPLYFVTKTTEERTLIREEKQLRRTNASHRGNCVRIRKVEVKTRTVTAIVPELPFKKLHRAPLWLGAFGDTLALAVAVSQLGKDWHEKEKIDVIAKTAGSVFSAIDSVSTAINFTFICTTKIPWLLQKLNPASKSIEAYYNVKDGIILMFFSDESEVMTALAKGDEIDAVLLMAKGVVLLSSVVPGTVALGAALLGYALMSSVIPVLGAGLAIAAIVVSGIEIIRYLRNGPENAMESIAERLKKAIKEELGNFEKEYLYNSRTVDLLASLSTNSKRLLGAMGV